MKRSRKERVSQESERGLIALVKTEFTCVSNIVRALQSLCPDDLFMITEGVLSVTFTRTFGSHGKEKEI